MRKYNKMSHNRKHSHKSYRKGCRKCLTKRRRARGTKGVRRHRHRQRSGKNGHWITGVVGNVTSYAVPG